MGLGALGPRHSRLVPVLLLASLVAACTAPPTDRTSGGAPVVGPSVSPSAGTASVLRLSSLEPDSLDPIELDEPHELQLADQIFHGLTEYEPQTLQAVPALARDWELEEGGAVIIFHLRKDLRFHDGTRLTAGHVVSSWSRLADPLVAAPFAFLLERVEGYDEFQRRPVTDLQGLEARDDRTLVVRLRTPWPDFVSLLGHPALAPVPPSAEDAAFGTEPVGTGPYRMAGPPAPGEPLILERFPRFYGEAPEIDELHVELAAEADDAWPDFLAGELDQATVPTSALGDAQARYGSGGVVPLGQLLTCGFNRADERFADPRLSIAVSLALDRQALADRVYGGVTIPATGFVPPTFPGAPADACGEGCRRNAEEARRLAGELPRESRTFALDYASSPVANAVAEAMAAQLGEAGLRVTPRPHEDREYLELLLQGRQQFFCLVWTADFPRPQAMLEPLLLPTSPDNHAGVDDRGLTDLLHAAREERSLSRRQRLYAEAERRALARMYLVPVVWFRSHLAVQPYVEGFAVDPLGRFDASALRIDR